jgi:hypothetical protein
MLVEKEVIRPGTYWYTDKDTGLPKKLVVTPELTKYWHDQGNAMLSAGLPVPVPYEHDFDAHPMTPKENLLNTAGEVKQYTIKNGDRLFSTVDIQDPDAQKKVGHAVRWTSPWFNTFTDGDGKEWKNVISHLALTTRPRINAHKQEPFSGIAAALSMATETASNSITSASGAAGAGAGGFCLSRAGRLFIGKKTKRLRPRYPLAFSLWGGGIRLSDDDMPPPKKKKAPVGDSPAEDEEEDEFGGDLPEDVAAEDAADNEADTAGLMNPLQDSGSDVAMEELLCDLLQALGVPMPDESNEGEFKRHLYEAAMSKIKELTSKGMGKDENEPDQNQPPSQQPNASQANPLIQQEQQPMYMSLEEINKIPDTTMKNIALSMYNENVKIRAEAEADRKKLGALNASKLAEENAKRQSKVDMLGRLSPKVKADLAVMVAMPSMALSMGDDGKVVDPMAQTLAVLEKGLQDMPRLLTTEQSALSVQPQPTDGDAMTEARADEIADGLARKMGAPAQAKKTA